MCPGKVYIKELYPLLKSLPSPNAGLLHGLSIVLQSLPNPELATIRGKTKKTGFILNTIHPDYCPWLKQQHGLCCLLSPSPPARVHWVPACATWPTGKLDSFHVQQAGSLWLHLPESTWAASHLQAAHTSEHQWKTAGQHAKGVCLFKHVRPGQVCTMQQSRWERRGPPKWINQSLLAH